jgi:hypothetical protein
MDQDEVMEPRRGSTSAGLDAPPAVPPHDRHLDAIAAAGFDTRRVTAG